MDYEAILSGKLLSLFPEQTLRDEVIAVLGLYGMETHEQEPVRVRLAILKLSGSSLIEIKNNTKLAKKDFRDILAWAEYPRQSQKWSMPDGPEKQKLIQADRAEYEQWLNT